MRASGQTGPVQLAAIVVYGLRRGLWCAALFVAAGAPSLQAQSAPQRTKDRPSAPTLAVFKDSLKQARAHALERNVPIVAVALIDKESDNVAARDELLASAEFAALSQHCVFFFSNPAQHTLAEVVETVDGTKRTVSVCSAFKTPSCKQHQQHWDELYNSFNEEGELRCPQVLVLSPDGKLADRLSPGHKPEVGAVIGAVAKLQAQLGRGLDEAELARLKDATLRASKAEIAGKTGSSWRAFAEVLSVSPDGARALAARQGQQRAVLALGVQRTAAEAKLTSDARLAGYLELEALAADWIGTEQGLELTRLLRKLEKEPLLRDALAKKKFADEAQALWDEAEVQTRAGQPKEAERKLRLLLRKYPGTPAFERAAKAYPDWLPQKPADK